MCLLLVLLCLSSFYAVSDTAELSKEDVEYIQSLIRKLSDSVPSGIIPPSTRIESLDQPPEPSLFNQPSVLLWNPVQTFKNTFPKGCVPCVECGSSSTVHFWADGSSSSRTPRWICGWNTPVLLVSAVLVCTNNHRILSHDERILQMLPSKTVIPFVLFHKAGFTKECAQNINLLCRRGVNFYAIESILYESYAESYMEKGQLFQLHQQQFCEKHPEVTLELAPFPPMQQKPPSNDLIAKCFLAHFLQHEEAYLCEISALPTTNSLSLDHTFKVAANIGYLREDKKWINMFDSLFLVFSDEGKIVAWRLAKHTSFGNIESLLLRLAERSRQQNVTIEHIYIDNCCHWRNKLQAIFGEQVEVHLDLFHAVQRISKKLPKRHPFIHQCMADLRLVFRHASDHGEKRKEPTPQPDEILKNLNAFVKKWESIEGNGKKILTDEALNEIDHLKVHIRKGCVSTIPPGSGTNRNEAFHSNIRSFFNRSRMGVLLAYALLSMLISAHNSRGPERHKITTMPLKARMGRTEESSSYMEPMGFTCDERQTVGVEADLWEQHYTEGLLDCDTLDAILKLCTSQFKLLELLRKKASMSMLWKYIPFMSPSHTLTPYTQTEQDWEQHEMRLKSTLQSCGFTRVKVPGNGDCFFTSVTLGLQSHSTLAEHLKSKDIDLTQDVPVIVSQLRKVMVQEMLQNKHVYENFFPPYACYDEVHKFVEMQYYDSEVGNAMPLAMARALQLPLVILTSIVGCPLVHVTPAHFLGDFPLFLAYNQCGGGHYDLAKFIGDGKPDLNSIACRCGVNHKDTAAVEVCTDGEQYKSRCKCLKNEKSCTLACSCKGCKNPFGERPSRSTHRAQRKRQCHEFQKQIPTAKRFAAERSAVAQGPWSDFETIVFVNVINTLHSHMIADTSYSIHEAYNQVVAFSMSPLCTTTISTTSVLQHKSLNQIQGKYEHFRKELDLFNQLSA